MPEAKISIYALLLAVGAIQAIFLILTLLTTGDNRKPANSILALLMALFAYDLFDEFLLQTGYMLYIPKLALFVHATDFAYGPIIYFYTLRLTAGSIKRHQLLHLAPAVLALISIVYLTLVYNAQQFVDYLLQHEETTFALEITDFIISVGGLFSMILYIAISLRLLKRHRVIINANYSYTESIDLNWLRYVLITLSLLISIYFGWFVSAVFLGGAYGFFEQLLYLGIVGSIFLLGFKGIKQPQIFANKQLLYNPADPQTGREPEAETGSYQSSALDKSESALIFDELQNLLSTQQLFLEPKLSLADLAEKSGFKIHYISQAINQNRKQNFFDFINHYRIHFAQDLLRQNPQQSVNILQIAMRSGFNSKSSFYNAFKKQTRQTPTQYRKEALKSPDL